MDNRGKDMNMMLGMRARMKGMKRIAEMTVGETTKEELLEDSALVVHGLFLDF